MDLAPQTFVKVRECSDQTLATVTVSNLTPEPVPVSNKAEVVSVSNRTIGGINSATTVNPNPLIRTEQPVKVHVVCAGSAFINLKVGGGGSRGIQARSDLGVEISSLSKQVVIVFDKKDGGPSHFRGHAQCRGENGF